MPGERCRLVLGNERVAVGDLDELTARQQVSQSPSMLWRHDTVFRCPDDQSRTVEGRQPLARSQQIALGPPSAARVLAQVAPDLSLRERWAQPSIHDLVWDGPLGHPAERERQAPQGAKAKRLQRGEEPAGHL